MRLFVAIDLSEEVRRATARLLAELKRVTSSVRWVRPEALHLTLKFIGHAEVGKLNSITESLTRIGVSGAVEAHFQGLGYFPHERRPRVLWIGIRANDVLYSLAEEVEAALEPLGIERERRAFAPHLTLGRFPTDRRRQIKSTELTHLQKTIADLPSADFGRLVTKEFFLFESKLSPGGAQYIKLSKFELGHGEN